MQALKQVMQIVISDFARLSLLNDFFLCDIGRHMKCLVWFKIGQVVTEGEATHSKMLVSKRRLTKGTRNFNIDMCLIIFAELGFKDGPRLVGINIRFTLWSKITILQSLIKNTSLSDWSWKQMVSTKKIEGPTSKFFYLGLPNSVLEPTYLQSRI